MFNPSDTHHTNFMTFKFLNPKACDITLCITEIVCISSCASVRQTRTLVNVKSGQTCCSKLSFITLTSYFFKSKVHTCQLFNFWSNTTITANSLGDGLEKFLKCRVHLWKSAPGVCEIRLDDGSYSSFPWKKLFKSRCLDKTIYETVLNLWEYNKKPPHQDALTTQAITAGSNQ